MIVLFKKFALALLVFWIISEVLSVAAFLLLPDKYNSIAFPFMPVFFVVVSFGLNYSLFGKKMPMQNVFVRRYLLVTFLRLFIYLIALALYLFFHRTDAIPFLTAYLLFFILFLVFEVLFMSGKEFKKH